MEPLACGFVHDFLDRVLLLSRTLQNHGFLVFKPGVILNSYDNTMAKRKKEKRQIMIYKIPHRNLKIEQC
jgi:hypothetical protein